MKMRYSVERVNNAPSCREELSLISLYLEYWIKTFDLNTFFQIYNKVNYVFIYFYCGNGISGFSIPWKRAEPYLFVPRVLDKNI